MNSKERPHMITNPLATAPKREKAGSETFEKYDYQYHWAFCRLITEHKKGNEYAVFIEEHEDVVVANSLDPQNVNFEFNQIKETQKKHTINSLTRKPKETSNSIIGKAALTAGGKDFSNRISAVNIVSTGDFKFTVHDGGDIYEVIKSGDLSEEEIDILQKAIIDESGFKDIIQKLSFIVPKNLPRTCFEDVIKAKIGDLIEFLASGSYYNTSIIYECIIRDFYKKGKNYFTYNDWNESLSNKAVTSNQFSVILSNHINKKPDSEITTELSAILKDEFNLRSVKRNSIRKSFNRYNIQRISHRNSALDKAKNNIRNEIAKHDCDDAYELTNKVIESISEETKSFFSTDDDLIGAILYEFLT